VGTLEELRAVALVESAEAFLPQRDLILKSRSCEFLLAPLKADKSYGLTRGTGVFGDAILAGIKVVVPAFVDSEHEFASVCISYEDAQELAQIFFDAAHAGGPATIDRKTLGRYSSASVRAAVFAQLGLRFGG
jgi:hypothetical protein